MLLKVIKLLKKLVVPVADETPLGEDGPLVWEPELELVTVLTQYSA